MIPLHDTVPCLTTEQMIEVDRAMIEDYGIELIQMMENAGRGLAHLARVEFLASAPKSRRVVVLAGTGGNGGGALVCARRLKTWGMDVRVATTAADRGYAGVPAHQLEIIRHMELPVLTVEALDADDPPDLIIDGIIGYSLRGAPRGVARSLIEWANATPAPVLALDVPSGVDADSGTVFSPAVRANATLTLALPKCGLLVESTADHVGDLFLADIGVPPDLYRRPAYDLDVAHIFSQSDIVQVRREG